MKPLHFSRKRIRGVDMTLIRLLVSSPVGDDRRRALVLAFCSCRLKNSSGLGKNTQSQKNSAN